MTGRAPRRSLHRKARFTPQEDAAIRRGVAAGKTFAMIAHELAVSGLGERSEKSVYLRAVNKLKLKSQRMRGERGAAPPGGGRRQAAAALRKGAVTPAFNEQSGGGFGGRIQPCFNLLCADGRRRMIGFLQAKALAAQIRAGRRAGESDEAIGERIGVRTGQFRALLAAVARDEARRRQACN